jgi:DNA-binding transcriptional LysR family regulator
MSRPIVDLENTLGARLLDRTPLGVGLTKYGRALLVRGTVVFDELKQGVRDIQYFSAQGSGELFNRGAQI